VADEIMKSADPGATIRALIIGLGVTVVILSVLFYTSAKAWLCENAWFNSTLIDGPTVILAIIAWRELGHSAEANEHRRQMSEDLSGTKRELSKMTEEAHKSGEYLWQRNNLEEQNVTLRAQLAASAQQIADNLKRPPTKAERNAATLRNFKRKMASVSQEGTQPIGYEIVEISDDNIVTLFLVRGSRSTRSFSSIADCGEMTIEETQQGGCALRIHLSKFIGQPKDWGECTRWEDRYGTAPSFEKAPRAACNASYGRGGSAETRTLNIFQSKDGTNSFQLESSEGWAVYGDNVQISKDFMATQIEYFAANFTRSTFGPGGANGGHKLFVS
jgi:hypothetical protein